MAIYEHISTFYGLEIEQFDPSKGIQDAAKAIRVEVDFYNDGAKILTHLNKLIGDPLVGQVKALVIGDWEEAFDNPIQFILDAICEAKDVFAELKAVFFSEVTGEQNEISWIQQGDYNPFLKAFPKLEHLQIRGSQGLSFGKMEHSALNTLIIETGGLPSEIIDEVAQANLPMLEQLELWTGDECYGWDGSVDTLLPLMKKETWPKLTKLGLKNSEITDEIVKAIVASDILPQLKDLDLSMGTLSDSGAQLILDNEDKLKHLNSINLAHHYLSDDLIAQLVSLGINMDLSDVQQEEDGDRYVEVSE